MANKGVFLAGRSVDTAQEIAGANKMDLDAYPEMVLVTDEVTSALRTHTDSPPTESPTKLKARTLEDVENASGPSRASTPCDVDEDSFVEKITCRSPAKPVSRIEDSVEALDRLEEA